jgi:phosphoglycerol transferase
MKNDEEKHNLKTLIKPLMAYLLATAVCLLVVALLFRIWHADLHIPFDYGGDAMFTSASIKGIIENGWFLHNPSIGLPTGLFFYDYPNFDSIYWVIIRIMSFFTSNWALVFNLFMLLGFPLVTLTSLYVLRRLKFSTLTAIVISLLYTFLPYHWLRAAGHIFLAVYFTVPLIIMVAIWVSSGEVIFAKHKKESANNNKPFAKSKIITSIVILILISCSGIYYAAFGLFFICLAGIAAYIKKRDAAVIWTTGLMALVVLFIIGLNASPYVVYRLQNGANPGAMERSYKESEDNGLKIVQLLLPVTGHRIPYLAQGRTKYDSQAPLVNENGSATLGLIGSLGFLFLLGWFLFSRGKDIKWLSFSINDVGLFNICAVLLGTIGGFSMVFTLGMAALGLPPTLRGWNRISVFIAFFAFIAVAAGMDNIKRYSVGRKQPAIFMIAAILVLAVGLFDQTVNAYPDYQGNKAKYEIDEEFVLQIEKSVPKETMIFQLPYMRFPEGPGAVKMNPYELLRGYLHSDTLKWSFGAMKGREGDIWQSKVSALPVDEMIKKVVAKGFRGIYIDRNGYLDDGAKIEQQIGAILKTKPIISKDGRLAFYKIPQEYVKDDK